MRWEFSTLGRANGTIRKSNLRLADLKATGDQTSKCSDKQYKYEAKICGWLTLKLGICYHPRRFNEFAKVGVGLRTAGWKAQQEENAI